MASEAESNPLARVDTTPSAATTLLMAPTEVANRFSNQYLVFFKAVKDAGMSISDFKIVEMPPPDMPAALYAHAVDAMLGTLNRIDAAEVVAISDPHQPSRELGEACALDGFHRCERRCPVPR